MSTLLTFIAGVVTGTAGTLLVLWLIDRAYNIGRDDGYAKREQEINEEN